MRPSRRASVATQTGSDKAKAASAKGSNKDAAVSGSKPSSKKDEGKPNSKPTSEKAASNDKAADANKIAEDPKASAQNPSTPVFTPEEDAKLLLMKSEGKKWGEIAAEIRKTKKQTTRRFGEIKPADWKPGKHGVDKAGVSDEKNDKQVINMGKPDKQVKQVEERKSKATAIDKHNNEKAPSTALLVAGKVEHKHAHRHEVLVRHTHEAEKHPRASAKEAPPPRRQTKDTSHSHPHNTRSSQPKPSHPAPPPSIATSSRTAYTLATTTTTTPSLTEDDLFSFGELQALSELIGKDMQGMWQRVSAAFFGMTGRRIAAEDIRDKFEGLSG